MTTTYNIFGGHLQFIGAPSGSFLITGIVTNYGGLPPANTVEQTFWFCQEAQGTSWLPGSLGGTYYPAGIYYSNGTVWQYQTSAYQATQGDVDAGIAESTFVSPKTLAGYSRWATKLNANSPITPGTGIKVTVDANGLVTAYSGATTSDIPEGSNYYFSDALAKASISTYIILADFTPGTTITGITSGLATSRIYSIPPNTIPVNCKMDIEFTYLISNTTVNASNYVRLMQSASATSTPPALVTSMGSFSYSTTASLARVSQSRNPTVIGGVVKNIPGITNSAGHIGQFSGVESGNIDITKWTHIGLSINNINNASMTFQAESMVIKIALPK